MSFSFVNARINQQIEKDLYRKRTIVNEQSSRFVIVDGKKYLNFSSNDYLGLNHNAQINKALVDGAEKFGTCSSASSLITGYGYAHQKLEESICEWLNIEKCLLFNSGFSANFGFMQALQGTDTHLFLDKLSHASLIDGVLASKLPFKRFRHNDYAHLDSLLNTNNAEDSIIATEGVFSMDGDKANLASLVDLAKQHNAELLVDEAHAFGLYGEKGKGLSHAYKDDIDFIITTFGKSFGSCGAVVACKDEYKQYLINRCRAFIYSTALPLPVLIWNIKALALIETMSAQRAHLQQLATRFRTELQKKGYHSKGDSHIVPLLLQSNDEAIHLANSLRQSHIHCMPIKHPTVPKGSERLRFSFSTLHQHSDIDAVLHNL